MKVSDLSKTQRSIMITSLFLSCVIFVMLIVFGVSNLGIGYSGFTVLLKDPMDCASLSLSETADFQVPMTYMRATVPTYMDNISGNSLPDDLDETDGEHNGRFYIAFTFYVKNVGTEDCNMLEKMQLDLNLKNALDALRIRIYRNGEKTDYAKLAANGQKEQVFCDKAFYTNEVIFEIENNNFMVGDLVKYTVVIWIEGDDPECLNDIRGGVVKLSMSFTVVDDES